LNAEKDKKIVLQSVVIDGASVHREKKRGHAWQINALGYRLTG
jgi:hypothetical protein